MKGRSIIEVTAVFLIIQMILVVPGIQRVIRWETRLLGWSYFTGALFVVISLMGIILTQGEFETYGLTLNNWRKSIQVGFDGFKYLLVPYLIYLIRLMVELDLRYLMSSIILGGSVFIALSLLLRRLQFKTFEEEKGKRYLAVVLILLLVPLIFSIVFGAFYFGIFSTLIWNFFMGGFGEEVLMRGFVQSRINDEFGRPWKFIGVSFGPGLVIAAFFHGLGRALSNLSPWSVLTTISWNWGIYAFFLGLFYGFLREKTGDIIASGIAHGLPNALGETFFEVLTR